MTMKMNVKLVGLALSSLIALAKGIYSILFYLFIIAIFIFDYIFYYPFFIIF